MAGQSKAISLAYQITHADNATPALAPDGKRMIYESVVEGKEQLFAMNVDGSSSIQTTRGPDRHDDPAWSPDGHKVALVSDQNDFQVIYIMNPDGTGMSRLTDKDSHAIHPNWSPDSKRVIYCSSDDLHPPKKNPSEIYSIDIETKNIVRLISRGVNTFPSWSPDGKQSLQLGAASVSIARLNAAFHFERDSLTPSSSPCPGGTNLDERVGDLHGLNDQSVARFHVLAVMADWWRVAPNQL